MTRSVLLGTLCCLALSGCLVGRGVHTVPIERDYHNLPDASYEDSKLTVDEAHRVGAHVFAPYEMESASAYLDQSYEESRDGDAKGGRDFAGLAKIYGEEAIKNGAGIADKGEMPMPKDQKSAWQEWERLKTRYLELDPCKAKLVAPVAYAHIETSLSRAEHELMECHHYVEAARIMRVIEPNIDAIWAKDTDGDGVVDMHDGEPWVPEDMDGYEDADGIPEPKPYPELRNVHFKTDKSDISPFGQGYLVGIADMLDDGYSETTINIEGHTDSTASDEYNMGLSQRRADSVDGYLKSVGVAEGRTATSFQGEREPIADNKTEKGRALNRRVELELDGPDVKSPYCNE